MTVYVTQEPRPKIYKRKKEGKEIEQAWTPDLSTAASYGDIKFVFSKEYNPILDAKLSYEIAADILADFNPSKDYLIETPMSGPVPSRACIMAIMARGHDDINFLNFHKRFNKEGKRDRDNAEYIPQRWSCNY